jgi:hypothetical protein
MTDTSELAVALGAFADDHPDVWRDMLDFIGEGPRWVPVVGAPIVVHDHDRLGPEQ